jgi:TATA-box binding protein (TBP) (component of TFIID and TFIIIB)
MTDPVSLRIKAAYDKIQLRSDDILVAGSAAAGAAGGFVPGNEGKTLPLTGLSTMTLHDIKAQVLNPLVVFTSTISGQLSNVKFNDKELIENIVPTGRILRIVNDHGERIQDGFDPNPPARVSNRGRKPRDKKPRTRHKGGEFQSFGSCILVTVDCTMKRYIVMVFVNGKIQIPGVINEDLSDAMEPIEAIIEMLTEFLHPSEPIQLTEYHAVMQNFKCTCDYKICIETMRQHLMDGIAYIPLMTNPENVAWVKTVADSAAEISDFIDPKSKKILKVARHPTLNQHIHRTGLIEQVCWIPEKQSALIIKVTSPTDKKRDKTTTVKIYESGKINIVGTNSVGDARAIYAWLNSYLYDNPDVLYKKV